MEQLKHECGVAMVRLLKPLEYYHQKYGTWMYGLNKLYLLMEKQHNRGQEGAGLACVKLEASPGEEYMFRERALGTGAITEIFAAVHDHYKDLPPGKLNDPLFAKANLPFAGEFYMGHLRYSTTGKSGISYVHPFLRRNNWRAKNLALCGNFNLTNVNDIFKEITAIGQHPRKYADTYIMLEQMGHRLDREVERLYRKYEEEGLRGMDITHAIEGERQRQIELIEEGKKVIQETRRWDDNKEYSYAMRSKEDAQDYRYFPEPDLVPIVISDEWIQKIKDQQPELRSEKLHVMRKIMIFHVMMRSSLPERRRWQISLRRPVQSAASRKKCPTG